MSVSFLPGHGGGDCPAAIMAQHYYQGDTKMIDSVFDAAQVYLSRRTHHEDITQALVEDDLRDDPGIRTTHYNGEWSLAVGNLGPSSGVSVGQISLACNEPLVAF